VTKVRQKDDKNVDFFAGSIPVPFDKQEKGTQRYLKNNANIFKIADFFLFGIEKKK